MLHIFVGSLGWIDIQTLDTNPLHEFCYFALTDLEASLKWKSRKSRHFKIVSGWIPPSEVPNDSGSALLASRSRARYAMYRSDGWANNEVSVCLPSVQTRSQATVGFLILGRHARIIGQIFDKAFGQIFD